MEDHMTQSERPAKKVVEIRRGVHFEEAFRAARAAGADEFLWNGNRYHTLYIHEAPKPTEPPAIIREWEEPAATRTDTPPGAAG